MTEWAPQAGDLVEIPGGTWHLLYQHGESMSGEPWFQVTDQFALGTAANPSRFVKLLCRAGDMATCWAELRRLGGAKHYRTVCYLNLETVTVSICQNGDTKAFPADGSVELGPSNYEAHMRDMQKFGALQQYIAACKERT